MRIDKKTIETYGLDKSMKALAFALKVKATYRNSIVYKATLHKLSQEFGKDRRTIKKYLRKLEEYDLITCQNGGDIKFKRLYRPNKYHFGINLKTLQASSIDEIEKLLYGQQLKNRIRIQNNAIETKRELIKGHAFGFSKSTRYYRAKARMFNLNFSDFNLNEPANKKKRLINNFNQFTIKTIAMEFHTSIEKTYDILRWLVNEGLLSIQRNITFIKKVYNKYELESLKKPGRTYFLSQSKSLFLVQANSYSMKIKSSE